LFELQDVFKHTKIIIVFGSAIRNLDKAKDIDVIFVFEKNKFQTVEDFVSRKNKILLKPIHKISQTMADLENNLKKKNPATISAVKTGHVLHGHEKLVEVMKNVTSF